jgi:hypothetical protein
VNSNENKKIVFMGLGDLVLEEPNAEYYLSLAKPTLKTADLLVGQGEVVFTDRGVSTHVDIIPAPGCPVSNIQAIASAGFNVLTLAGNHIWDSGLPGIEDTMNGLRNCGVETVGAGMNIEEASKPVIVDRQGTKFGFLSYNCVGPRGSWALPNKPGCAYVKIISHYEMDHANPGGAPTTYTFVDYKSLDEMVNNIQKLRPLCDVLVMALHKGIVGLPVKLAMYEQPLCHAAIDAGADIILGSHAHILKGIELYKGKVIFHGLSHFTMATRKLTDVQKKTRAMWGVETKLQDPANLIGNEGSMAIIAKCIIENKKITKVSFLPCLLNEKTQPEILKHDSRGEELFNYMKKITEEAELNTKFKWDGDEILILNQ